MSYSVFVNQKGIIEIQFPKIPVIEDYVVVSQKVVALVSKLENGIGPVNILLDSSLVRKWGRGAPKIMKIILMNSKFNKFATFGANKKITELQHQLIAKTNLEDKMKVFKTREEAEAWLLSNY